MTTPLLAPPEAQPAIPDDEPAVATESLARPFRLGLVGLGATIGLFVRLLAANSIGGLSLDSRALMVGVAISSAMIGLGLLLVAAERDRFGPALVWISLITALAWGSLNWISPPFGDSVTIWSRPDQVVLAVLGVGNGLLLAGVAALAFVRRLPTMTVALTTIAGVCALAANTIVLRSEWPAILSLGAAFGLILIAWDRSPRRELAFIRPEDPPRVSRAVLSFISVALCGTAIQLWTSRTEIPRSFPAVAVCGVLIIGAFASLIRVRREIEQRETTLSEWTSWVREIRTNDFRADMQNFEPDGSVAISTDEPPLVEADGQAPRKLSFPGLAYTDPNSVEEAIQPSSPPTSDAPPQPSLPAPTTEIPAPVADTPDPAPQIVIPRVAAVAEPAPTRSPQTVPPQTVPPQTVPPQTVPPQTLPPQTVPPQTVPPLPVAVPAATAPKSGGAFSSLLDPEPPAPTSLPPGSQVTDLEALAAWLGAPTAAARVMPLLVAVEAISLDEFESLPASDAAMATIEIGSFLADTMPDADLVSWIDGPYFIVAHASKPNSELLDLNKAVLKSLKATDGTLAFIRPTADADLDTVVNECVMGLLQARTAKDHAAGR